MKYIKNYENFFSKLFKKTPKDKLLSWEWLFNLPINYQLESCFKKWYVNLSDASVGGVWQHCIEFKYFPIEEIR